MEEQKTTSASIPTATPTSVNTKTKRWVGDTPENCDICSNHIGDTFVDGKTRFGAWANMCQPCHTTYGLGIGIGLGQMYDTKTGLLLHG